MVAEPTTSFAARHGKLTPFCEENQAVWTSQLRKSSRTPSQFLKSLANPPASGTSPRFELVLSIAFVAVAEIRVAKLQRRHTLAESEPVRIPVGSLRTCGPAWTRPELQRLEESDQRRAVLIRQVEPELVALDGIRPCAKGFPTSRNVVVA